MKEQFLKELEDALKKSSVENVSEILEVYSSRFDLGYEAGLTDEDILEQLGDVDSIVDQYTSEKDGEKRFTVTLGLHYFSDFEIVNSEEPGIRFELDEEVYNYITLERDEHYIKLVPKNLHHIIRRKIGKYDGTMKIGPDVVLDNLTIDNLGCDIKVENIFSRIIGITNINGDIRVDRLEAEERTSINTTSGDIDLDFVSSPKLVLNAVSGDIDIDDLTSDEVKISIVSGDVKISSSNDAVYKISSVSGDVTIEEEIDVTKVSYSAVSGNCMVGGRKVGKDLSTTIREQFSKMKF